MKCPRCGLINDPWAPRCDCGFAFPRGDPGEADRVEQERRDRRGRGKFNLIVGLASIATSVGAFVFLLETTSGAESIVFWGLALIGARTAASGWRDYREK